MGAEGLRSSPLQWPLHLAITLGKFLWTLIFPKLRRAASALSKDQEHPRQAPPHPSPACPQQWTPQEGGDPRTLLPPASHNLCSFVLPRPLPLLYLVSTGSLHAYIVCLPHQQVCFSRTQPLVHHFKTSSTWHRSQGSTEAPQIILK